MTLTTRTGLARSSSQRTGNRHLNVEAVAQSASGDSRNASASRESRDRRPEHGGRGAECERRLQEQEGGNETRGERALEDLNMCKGRSKGEVHQDCGHR